MQAVSLFDFDEADEEYVSQQLGQVFTADLPIVALISIRRDTLNQEKMHLPDASRDPALIYVRRIEVLHIGPIPASAFNGFIMATTSSEDVRLSPEVRPGSDAFSSLSQVSATWMAEYEQRKAERHARGEYDLAELIAISKKLKNDTPGR
jgi:hypothetical protein